MNLRNGQITVGEILRDPRARGMLQQEAPQLAGMLNSPMAMAWKNMPLNAVAVQARRFLPANRVQYLMDRLKSL